MIQSPTRGILVRPETRRGTVCAKRYDTEFIPFREKLTSSVHVKQLFQRLFDEPERQQSSPLFILNQRRDLPAKSKKIRRPGQNR